MPVVSAGAEVLLELEGSEAVVVLEEPPQPARAAAIRQMQTSRANTRLK